MPRRFRWLTRLFPPSFREEHETEMWQAWRDEQVDAAREGRRGVWRDALRDTLRVAPREHAATWARNVRLAIRRLRRAPGFAVAAILTLSVGTGAVASVFSLVNAVLLRPLPWRAPNLVGVVWAVPPSGQRTWLSFPELEDLRRDAPTLSGVVGLMDLRPQFLAGGIGHELQALAVSPELFDLLGVLPSLGRSFQAHDDEQGAAPVVIVSHGFWRSQLGASLDAVGRSIVLDGRSYQVIGVLPAGFSILPISSVFPPQVDVWLPLTPHLPSRDRSVRFLHALARVRDEGGFDRTRNTLQAYASRVGREYATAYPGGAWSFTFESFTDDVLQQARPALYLVSALAGLVLVIACANVANLLLARGEARRAELAIRTALGAGPARLAGELLAEAFVLATAGSAGGLAVAAAAPRLLRAMNDNALPRLDEARVDGAVAAFMFGLVLLTMLLFAALPLVERIRFRNVASIVGTRSGTGTRRSMRIGRALVMFQTALASTAIVTTFFLTESLARMYEIDLGFSPRGLVAGRISTSPRYATGASIATFFEQVTARVAEIRGVTGAAAITQLPLSGAMLGSTFLSDSRVAAARIDADLRGVTPGYFDVMRTPLVAGRTFTAQDSDATPQVAIVDETFARRLDARALVVGKRIRWFRMPDVEIEIVGVVAAVHHRGPDVAPRPTVYRPHRQYPRSSMFVVARTQPQSGPTVGEIRAAIADVDPSQPLADVATMDERLARTVSRARTAVMLAGVLGAISLFLALVGLYGVLSFAVTHRVREFGVRLALGATPTSVRRMVVREGLTLSAAGIAVGVAGAVGVVQLARTLLFEIAVGDLHPYALATVLVAAGSTAALWFPARRASTTEPTRALQTE